MTGLKICTRCRAISARFKRRINSSLLPENMGPTITSIHPMFPFTMSTWPSPLKLCCRRIAQQAVTPAIVIEKLELNRSVATYFSVHLHPLLSVYIRGCKAITHATAAPVSPCHNVPEEIFSAHLHLQTR